MRSFLFLQHTPMPTRSTWDSSKLFDRTVVCEHVSSNYIQMILIKPTFFYLLGRPHLLRRVSIWYITPTLFVRDYSCIYSFRCMSFLLKVHWPTYDFFQFLDQWSDNVESRHDEDFKDPSSDILNIFRRASQVFAFKAKYEWTLRLQVQRVGAVHSFTISQPCLHTDRWSLTSQCKQGDIPP